MKKIEIYGYAHLNCFLNGRIYIKKNNMMLFANSKFSCKTYSLSSLLRCILVRPFCFYFRLTSSELDAASSLFTHSKFIIRLSSNSNSLIFV